MNRQAQCLMRLRQQLFNECCSSRPSSGLSAVRSVQTQALRASSVASTSKLPSPCRQKPRTATVKKPRRRHFSIGSMLSPAAMRAYALKVQAESDPDDPAKHAAYFAVLLESGSKENASQAVQHYEQQSGLNSNDSTKRRSSLLQDQKLFDLYLAALAISNGSSNAATKLAQAAQRRDAVINATSSLRNSSAIAETATPLNLSPPRPTLTDAQIASAVLSRENPNASVRVLGHDTSASPQPDKNTAAAPLAAAAVAPISSAADTSAATPQTPSVAIGSIAGTSASSASSSSPSPGGTPPPASSGAPPEAARSANEPIRVVVEEARGNLFLRAAAWTGRTLFVTFLTLTLLSFLIDQSGIMRGATGKGGPNEFLPPASGKTYKFADVHGCEEAKAELEEVVEFLKDPKKFSALGGRLPRGVLLTGPPGTGKTLLARAVAGEAGVKFLFASGSEFDEMYVGVGARRVRELFTAAKANAPAIIFIDELDAVGGKRSPKNMQYQQQTLNELLVQLDGFAQTEGVILIGATNFPESLDKALVRPGRFDRHIVVPLPDVRGRLAILKHHMTDVKSDPSVDVSLLARGTPGFSGADLQNLVNQAAVQAARSGKPSVGAFDFDWAKDRIMMGSQRKSAVITPEDKRLTAFHEAGHALVALMTEGSTPLHSVTCLPRGASLGLTSFLPEMDVTNHTFIQLKANLDVAFGGRAAEEIVYGKLNVTTGASSDIKQATNIANSMVRHYGYSDVVGPVDTSNNDILSPSTRTMIDEEVRRMLEEAKQRAFDVLTTNRVKLERLANALIEFETLSKSEVLKVIEGQKLNKVMP